MLPYGFMLLSHRDQLQMEAYIKLWERADTFASEQWEGQRDGERIGWLRADRRARDGAQSNNSEIVTCAKMKSQDA